MKRGIRIAVVVGIILLLIIGMGLSRSYQLPQFHGGRYYEPFWTLSGNGNEAVVELPLAMEYSGGGKQTLSAVLAYEPEDTEAPYVFVAMNHMYFQVYLDNSLIYSYTREDTADWSKSPGNTYTMIPLDRNCTGKELRIDFWMTLEDGLVYEIENVFFGDYGSILYEEFWDNLPHNIVTICILLLGIVMLILGIITVKQGYSRDIWNIGLFAALFGIYTLTENRFNLYLLANPYFTYLINFFVFAAIQIPLLLFFKDKVTTIFRKWYNLLLVLCTMNLAVQAILHFMKIKDIRQMLICTHLLYAAVFFLVILSVIKIPKDGYRGKKYILLATLPILIGGAIDAVYYYINITDSSRNTFYSQLGVLIFLVVEAVYMLKNLLLTSEEKIRSEYYRVMAYKDGLTGIYNRAAFMEALKAINEKQDDFQEMIVICLDLNNMKYINDCFGHQAGDQVLCKTAELLQEYIGKDGGLFRVGGDEFAVLVNHVGIDEVLVRFEQMAQAVDNYNRESGFKLEFAMGCKALKDCENIDACVKRADEKMYEDKRMKKERF